MGNVYDPSILGENYDITMIQDEKGEPWWVAKDVCEVLGLEAKHAVSRLDHDEKSKVVLTDLQTPGRGGDNGSRLIINEPGLYSLIMRSRKLKAKTFKRWVTHEVLPEIRKTGAYVHATDSQKVPTLAKEVISLNERIEQDRPGGCDQKGLDLIFVVLRTWILIRDTAVFYKVHNH